MRFPILASLLAATLASTSFAAESARFDLTVDITGIRSGAGKIRAVLCTAQERFPDSCRISSIATAVVGNTTLVFHGVPDGVYALAAFHDENGNGQLDIGNGFPKEGLAFSNNVMGERGVPAFSASAFKLIQHSRLPVRMRYLGAR
ncbi:DUF2141 domain-containing protein [Chitinimonas sp.]|uniref:DUF2141 domain-containing protein n=1 Tax=Chitinimonas sp. TaxID=1934313 RepID=UPI0035AF775C